MTVLATVLALVLAAIAALHVYWGFGGLWPGSDLSDLARRVAGFKNGGGRSAQSPAACLLVAAALCFSALIALILGGVIASPLPYIVVVSAALLIMLIFLGRGVAGYTPAWRRLTPVQPFAALDVRYYSPLCLAIGVGLAVLALNGFFA
jgi:hypothetical protein